jgi:ribosomally synthesized peptide (two-chain TOMM family)
VITTNNAASSIQQFGKIWPQCIARAWQDAEFREALKRDPTGTLRQSFQFIFPEGVKVEIVEGLAAEQATQADTLRMVIPPAPAMELHQVAITDVEKGMDGAKPYSHFSEHFTFTS